MLDLSDYKSKSAFTRKKKKKHSALYRGRNRRFTLTLVPDGSYQLSLGQKASQEGPPLGLNSLTLDFQSVRILENRLSELSR